MDSVAVMLFNQQVFHLECFLLIVLLFQIKSQSVIAYKSVVYKWVIYVVFKSSKNETWPHDFIFMFIWYFIVAILLRKSSKAGGLGKI